MYRYLAIANYEDRFVVPSTPSGTGAAMPSRRTQRLRLYLSGDGCHGSDSKFNLFNSRRIDAIDVTSKTEPHP